MNRFTYNPRSGSRSDLFNAPRKAPLRKQQEQRGAVLVVSLLILLALTLLGVSSMD